MKKGTGMIVIEIIALIIMISIIAYIFILSNKLVNPWK